MAKYTTGLTGNFDEVLHSIHSSLMDSSASIAHEEQQNFEYENVRCAVNVYERYSYMGQNRCSLSLTLFGKDDDIQLTAITSGGSQAVFFKINTIGEKSFFKLLIDIVERIKGEKS